MRTIIKPVLIGAAVYLLLYAVLLAMYQLPDDLLTNQWVQLILTPYHLVMLPACGYIAARISRQQGISVGAACGVVVALGTVAVSASILGPAWYGESLLVATLGSAIKYGFYSGLGGGVGELHARKRFSA